MAARVAVAVLGVILTSLLLVHPDAGAQSSFRVENDKASKGKALFTQKGCQGCHSIGFGQNAGPDLLNVTQRVPADWLRRFLKSPQAMHDAGDARTVALVEQHNGHVMPNFRLKDDEIEALIHFLASGMKR